ncbi:Protein obstructor-E [Nymphon striatum]|nr:Protein obstructor-E [Nymphon striatum]
MAIISVQCGAACPNVSQVTEALIRCWCTKCVVGRGKCKKMEAQIQPEVDCSKLPDGFYPAEDQCDAYIHCKNGEPIEELCPDGKVFKIPKYKKEFKTLRCVFPFGVDCSERPNLQTPKGTGDCPRLWGLYPVTGDCEKFKYCVHGTPLIQSCPHDLAFNPVTGTCDYPDNVPDCSDVIDFECPVPDTFNLLGFYSRFPHPTECTKEEHNIKRHDAQS